MTETTVIIVSWNCRDDLRACLKSLQQSGIDSVGSVVVVDNASSDGSAEMVRQEFPFASLQRSSSNVGFAAANNFAIRKTHSPYVLLLNPDTEVLPPGLGPLVAFMDAHPAVWAAGPTLLNTDRSHQRTGVRFPSVWNLLVEAMFLDRLFPGTHLFGSHRELYRMDAGPRQVDYTQGSCLIVRKDAVERSVGLIDEGYFMYFEETDWCYRMRKAGGEVWIVPEARVVHRGGGTTGHYDERRILHYHRSLFRYISKNADARTAFAVRAVIVLRCLLRLFLWSVIAIVRPSLRAQASSATRGYRRVLPICFGHVSAPTET